MKKERLLINCIDEILAGKYTVEDCLARYPELSNELRPLLDIVVDIQPERVSASSEFKQRARSRLFEAMQTPKIDSKHRRLDIFSWLKPTAPPRRLNFSLITATVILVLFIASGTTAYAAQDSLPDDVLYPVKTGIEKVQLALTIGPENRANLHLNLAERRLEEIVTQSHQGRDISPSSLENYVKHTDAAIGEISNIPSEDSRAFVSQLSNFAINQQVTLDQVQEVAPQAAQSALKQALNATQRGNIVARIAHGNSAYLSSSPSVSSENLETAYFEIEGLLIAAEGETWNLGGIILNNVNSSMETPPAGSRVYIEGLVQDDKIFVSKIKHRRETGNQVKIKGVFNGTSPDGTTWYVGGIPIAEPQNITRPAQEKQLELTGIIQNGVFIIGEVESEEVKEETEVSGILIEANPGKKTLTMEVAGAEITINISEAVIISTDGEPLRLVDLKSFVGEDIKVNNLSRKEGLLYAQNVYVDIEQKANATDNNQGKNKGKGNGKDK